MLVLVVQAARSAAILTAVLLPRWQSDHTTSIARASAVKQRQLLPQLPTQGHAQVIRGRNALRTRFQLATALAVMSAAAQELVQITALVVELPALRRMSVSIPEQLVLMLPTAKELLTLQRYVQQMAVK